MAYERLYVFTKPDCQWCEKAKEIINGTFKRNNPTVMVVYLSGSNNRFGWTPQILPAYILASGSTAIGQPYEGLLDSKRLQDFFDSATGKKTMGKIT